TLLHGLARDGPLWRRVALGTAVAGDGDRPGGRWPTGTAGINGPAGAVHFSLSDRLFHARAPVSPMEGSGAFSGGRGRVVGTGCGGESSASARVWRCVRTTGHN